MSNLTRILFLILDSYFLTPLLIALIVDMFLFAYWIFLSIYFSQTLTLIHFPKAGI